MTTIEALEILKNNQCRCGNGKRYKTAFCNSCYRLLPPTLQSDLWSKLGNGFEQAYHLAEHLLIKIEKNPNATIGKCKDCRTWVVFLKLKKDDGTFGKNNPIELKPHPKGNLVLSLEKGLYRYATDDELELARTQNKNLYVSHFAYCPFAKSFTKNQKVRRIEMKGKIKKVGMTEKNEPIYQITTPKHLRRKLGRFIRQFNKSCIDPRHRFKKFPRSTETIVGIQGEKCSYYDGLSVIRFNDRVNWNDIEGSPKLKCQTCSFTTDSEDLLAAHIDRAHIPAKIEQIIERIKRELNCSPNCGHSDDEHSAFDLGVADGEMGFEADPPFDDPELRGAWFSGHSVGMLNRIN